MGKSKRLPRGGQIIHGDYVAGDKVAGDKVLGDKVLGDKSVGRGDEDFRTMMSFVAAVQHRLDELGEPTRNPAAATLVQIDEERRGRGSRRRLRELGRSLRAVLEGASGDVVAGSLLGIWQPPG